MLSGNELEKICTAPFEVTSTAEDPIFGIKKGSLYKGNSLEIAKNTFREEWLKIINIDVDEARLLQNPITSKDHIALWCDAKKGDGRIIATLIYPITENPDRVFSIF